MSGLDWAALGARLGLQAGDHCLRGIAGRYPVGVTSRDTATWLGLIVANADQRCWTLTRRWEPQARPPRRPDATTVKFADRRLTERYVGAAEDSAWFRDRLGAGAADALVEAADANRLGACSIDLRDHLLTARYRCAASDVPDLSETLAALGALAACIDSPEATLPDLATVPLLTGGGNVPAQRMTRLEVDRARLTATLARQPGLRARVHPAPAVVVDWDAGRLQNLDTTLPLEAIRQVAIVAERDGAFCAVTDVGGAIVFAGRLAGGPPQIPTSLAQVSPPLVYARADR